MQKLPSEISLFVFNQLRNRAQLVIKDCIISETSRTPEMAEDNLLQAILSTGATFEMNNAKRYVS